MVDAVPRRRVKLRKLLLGLAAGVIAGNVVAFGFAFTVHAVAVARVGQEGIYALDGTWGWFALGLLALSPDPLPLTIVRASGDAAAGTPAVAAEGITVAQPKTDAAGSFSVRLDPGRYYVYGRGITGLTTPRPMFFDVSPGSTTSVEVRYAQSTP